jgi:hypothetical protein
LAKNDFTGPILARITTLTRLASLYAAPPAAPVVVNVLAGTGYTIDRGTATGRIVDTVDPRFKGIEDDGIRINGISIGAIGDALTADDRLSQMQDAINAQTALTGVSAAVDPSTGGLSLTAADGRNLSVAIAAGGATAAELGLSGTTAHRQCASHLLGKRRTVACYICRLLVVTIAFNTACMRGI